MGGTLTGPLYWTATGGNTSRSAQDRAADVINVLDHGADPTGVVDSSPAFASALALRRDGRPVDVYAPTGVYRLNNPITVGHATYAQRLFGNGWATVLLVGPGFSASANGVILTVTSNTQMAQASVTDLQILFEQPPDVSTTTTASTAIGSTDLTLASVAGIQVGYYCRDMNDANALPFQSTMPKVVSIVGNVVTLDRTAIHVISTGHVMQFAANRSMAVSLSSSPTLTPGAPAIQYPWAIYAVSQSVFIDHVIVGGGWNGIYIRGSTFIIGQYLTACLNIGLDIDQCYNFPKLDHYQFWAGFGFPTTVAAMLGIYYDGQTVALNVGRCDDFAADFIQSWCGIVNFASTFSWAQINQLKLDGSNANLNVVGNGWAQIGNCYSTNGSDTVGTPFVLSGNCKIEMGALWMAAAQATTSIVVSNGALTIGRGQIWNGQQSGNPMISVTGGDLMIDQMRFDSSTGRTSTYLSQTGGSVRVTDSVFIIPPGAGGRAFSLTDNVLNAIINVEQNGWAFSPPGTLGRYETRTVSGVTHHNAGTVFASEDTPTTAMVAIRPPLTGPVAAESKLRLYGSFSSGADYVPRLATSIRSGFASAGWTAPYMDFWLGTGATNDVASDANMARMFSLRYALTGLTTTVGFDAAASNIFALNGAVNSGRRLQWQTAGAPRWVITPANTEAGANAGADMRFDAYDDTGNFLFSPMILTRSTGLISLNKGLSFGSVVGASNTDVSRHIALFGSAYGIGITASRMNVVAATGTVVGFVINAADRMTVSESAVTMLQPLTINAAGPTIRSGTGAATGTQPAGSLWLRTDGATGTRIYVSSGGGTWLPIAGV
jgi:hypothetical protein